MNMFSLYHLFSGFSFKMHSFHCQFTVYGVNYCICGNKLYDVFPGLLETELGGARHYSVMNTFIPLWSLYRQKDMCIWKPQTPV